MAIYLVGGAVRDLLLNNKPHDFDYVFSESEELFQATHPQVKKVGQQKNIYLYHGLEYSPMFGGDIWADLENRDLTINALAIGEDGRLYCHPQALTDLREKILRAVSPKAFLNDPVRIFRLARFLTQDLDFQLADETKQLLAEFPKSLLAIQPKERVAHELLRALTSRYPERFFLFLAQYDLLRPWFTELDLGQNIPAGPIKYHQSSVFGHTMHVLAKVAGTPLTCWMAICHDLGKVTTPQDILPHHYGHDLRGIELAQALSLRLGLPKRYLKAAMLASDEHMRGGLYTTMRIGQRRDLLWNVHRQNLMDEFWQLVCADSQQDFGLMAKDELEVILKVKLPKEFQNLGERSSLVLRDLQCQALASSRSRTNSRKE